MRNSNKEAISFNISTSNFVIFKKLQSSTARHVVKEKHDIEDWLNTNVEFESNRKLFENQVAFSLNSFKDRYL